jgi:hypothetical protein
LKVVHLLILLATDIAQGTLVNDVGEGWIDGSNVLSGFAHFLC